MLEWYTLSEDGCPGGRDAAITQETITMLLWTIYQVGSRGESKDCPLPARGKPGYFAVCTNWDGETVEWSEAAKKWETIGRERFQALLGNKWQCHTSPT